MDGIVKCMTSPLAGRDAVPDLAVEGFVEEGAGVRMAMATLVFAIRISLSRPHTDAEASA